MFTLFFSHLFIYFIIFPIFSTQEYDEAVTPDQQYYLNHASPDEIDYSLVVQLIETIHAHPTHDFTDALGNTIRGAVLVFVAGMDEIRQLQMRLSECRSSAVLMVVAVHSAMAPERQQEAFRHPPLGKRKVILATNIAETSLTIDDVTCGN